MIRGLAIETSGRIGSVALARDGEVFSHETFEHGLQHAARIIPAIDNLCRQAAWNPSEIHEIYVSAGPGSFTGLRIGITLANLSILKTNKARAIRFSTLEALCRALQCQPGDLIEFVPSTDGAVIDADEGEDEA